MYVIFGTLLGGVCFNTNSTITEFRYRSNVIDVNSNAENLTTPLVVALWMTRVSIYWEATVGFGTMLVVCFCMFRFFKPRLFCCFDETRLNEIHSALKPLVLFDCVFIIIFGPVGNVYMFLLDCVETYVTIFLQIGFYLTALALPVVFSYLRKRDDEPMEGELKELIGILIKLALKLITCSSCLATFIIIAYPERIIFRYSYLGFTVIIGVSALLTYHET